MRIDLTDVSPVKKTMEIEVDAEEVRKETLAAVRRIGKSVRIPGFRPGHAPAAELRRRFGKEIEEDVRDRMLSRLYRDAMREKGLRPVGEPVVDEVHQKEGEPFRFKTTFEVLPEFELTGHRGVEVLRTPVAVGEDEVDSALEEIRKSRVQLVTEEGRSAGQGDVVLVDAEGQPEDGEVFRRERMLIEIGEPNNLPAFNEHLQGAVAGVDLEFEVTYPEDYNGKELAGKRIEYRLHVHEVKRKELPALDDEFAKDLGEFDDLAGLRARISEDLKHRKKHEAERALRQSVLDKVLLENPIALPEGLVESEIRHRLEDAIGGLIRQGVDPKELDLDWDELRKRQEEPGRKAVHARLVLDAVARAEDVSVDNKELDDRIRRDADSMGEKFAELRKRIQEQGGLEVVRGQLVREKSLDLLVSVANIQGEE